MYCTRCRGVMAEDQFFDLEGAGELNWMRGWRCMNCGHAENPLTEANRRLRESALLLVSSEESGGINRNLCGKGARRRTVQCGEAMEGRGRGCSGRLY